MDSAAYNLELLAVYYLSDILLQQSRQPSANSIDIGHLSGLFQKNDLHGLEKGRQSTRLEVSHCITDNLVAGRDEQLTDRLLVFCGQGLRKHGCD